MQIANWDAIAQMAAEQEREFSEINMRQSHPIFRALCEIMPDAALLVTEIGDIVAANDHAEALFGYTFDEMKGQKIEMLIPARLRLQHAIERAEYGTDPHLRPMGTGPSFVAIRKDKSEFPVDVMLRPLPIADPGCILAVARDLSGRLSSYQQVEAEINEMQHRLLDSEENERQRLAQELHDGPLQELHSLDFRLVALTRETSDPRSQGQLLEMRATLREVSRHLRAICQDLRPPALTPFGVSAVIRSFADSFQQDHPELVVMLDLEEDGQLLLERGRLSLYRICQHALRNVAEHASARHVAISLHLTDSEIELCIKDDGVGFEVPEEWSQMIRLNNFGLLGCLERAEAIGGRLLLESKPGQGTTLCVTAPLVPAQNSAESL